MRKFIGLAIGWAGITFGGWGFNHAAAMERIASQSKAERVHFVENGLREVEMGPQGIVQTDRPAALRDRMAFYKVPGLSLAVIDNQKIDWVKSYGVLKAGEPAPVTPSSLFEAASTTKLLTGVLALRMVEEGKLALDEDVNAFLKTYKVPENEFTRRRKVTLRGLLTHSAGLPATSMGSDDGAVAPTLDQVLRGQAPARNKPAVAEYEPGSRWQYSNIGYVLIQQMLEDVSGKPLAKLARELVFQPLGMKASTLAYPLPASRRAGEAMPHTDEGKPAAPAMHPTALAQGGLMTTPEDLAKLAIDLMRSYRGEKGRVLSKATVRLAFRKELDPDPRQFMGLPIHQGLGVLLRGEGDNFSFLFPGHNFPGTMCWLEACPAAGKGVVVMANGNTGEPLVFEILAGLFALYRWPTGPYFR